MSGTIRKSVLLLGTALSTQLIAQAQQTTTPAHTTDVDVAVTYVAERAKIASVNCGCFWLNGGSGNVAATFYRGLGVAANLTGDHASGVTTGVDLNKVMFVAGPRYTYSRKSRMEKKPGIAVFGEALFGVVHGFDTVFPGPTGTISAASSFAMQVGGGVDLRVARHIGIRALEADYVYSTLPNNAGNIQHDLKLAAGVSFHFSSKK